MAPIEVDRLLRLRGLAETPFEDRDEEWVREFEGAFWPALICDSRRLVYGTNDQRPYRRLGFEAEEQTTLPGMGAQLVRPASLVDELIQEGQGLFFGNEGEEPFCVFTLGQVVGYRVFGRAMTPIHEPPSPPLTQLSRGETIQCRAPNPARFPDVARINVRRHLKTALDIQEPKAICVQMPDGRSGLAFDFEPTRVQDEARIQEAFNALGWLLPARLCPYFRLDFLNDSPEMKPF